jgi:hypothetical protein
MGMGLGIQRGLPLFTARADLPQRMGMANAATNSGIG